MEERTGQRTVAIDGKVYRYTLILSYKRRKSVSMTLNEKGEFVLRSSPFFSSKSLDDFAISAIPKLLARAKRKGPSPYDDGYLFLFGKRVHDEEYPLLPKEKKAAFLKKELMGYLKERFPLYVQKMGIGSPLCYEVKNLRSAYGIYHPKKGCITFASFLAHYSPRAIDSVIAHELTHYFVRAHDGAFYARLLDAFPDYWECRKELIHQDYEGKNRLAKQQGDPKDHRSY